FAGTKEIEGHDLFTYDNEFLDDGRMMLRTVDYYFPATVTDLTVNFTQPECDQTPDFTPTVTTNLPDGQIYLDPDRISWSDVAGWGMTESDTFEAGHTYVVEAYFDSNYELTEYPADSTGAFTGTLNLDGMTLISAEVSNGNSLYIVAYKEIPLTFLSDETTTFTQGNAPDLLTIRCNGSIGDFDHLEVNGQKQEDDTYELTEGSTIVTFDKSYLNTLQPGTYDVTFVYNVEEIVIIPGNPAAKASKASTSAVTAPAPLASYRSKAVQKTATVRIIVNAQTAPQKPATGVGDISFVYITFLVSCMGLALLLKEKIQLNK
ncbi:MAG: hypothetical protein HUJ58_06365, partial [Erysipelotrichaceae bacterium]|nr:hypothetical protein [Erysipelotrichaceae bacterium]